MRISQVYLWTTVLALLSFVASEDARGEDGQKAPSPITATHALGEIKSVDMQSMRLVLTTTAGEITVVFDGSAQFLQVPPGETTLAKASPIPSGQIAAGDRVLARGKVSQDRKTITARQIIVMTKAAIDQKQAREREEWRERGVSGTITAIDPASRSVSLRLFSPGTAQILTVEVKRASFRRYAPDSIKFADALPSAFEQLKIGDQLRALGKKDETGNRLDAETVVSGSFTMAGGPITAVDPENKTISINNLQTRSPLTILIKEDSLLRRIPPEFANMLARRAQMIQGQNGGNSGSPQRSLTSGKGQGAGQTPQFGGQGGQGRPGGLGGPPGAGMRGDLSQLFQRLPAISLGELKVGELVLVSSTVGSDTSRVTAIQLATGVEPLLTEPSRQGAYDGDSLTFPSGVFDLGMSMP